LDNVVSKNTYNNIGGIVFSPDGKRLGYVANKGEQYVVVLNNDESKSYQNIGTLETSAGEVAMIFSNDSQKVAYKAVDGQQEFVVVNDVAGKKYDSISNFVFLDNGSYTYQAKTGEKQVTVVNQKEVVTPPPTSTTGGQATNYQPTPGTPADFSSNDSGGRDLHLDPNRLQYSVCSGDNAHGPGCNF
jgi:hypothetical protein